MRSDANLGSMKDKYNTDINIIGSIKDLNVIERALKAHFTEDDSINSLIKDRNEFVYNTNKTTSRIASGIESAFVNFKNDKHSDLYKILFTNNYSDELLKYAIFLQFAINNSLFLLITNEVFIKTLMSGRIGIKTDDIYSYLKNALDTGLIKDVKWSESTIKIIPTKYLNFMGKLGFVDEKTKEFKYISLSSASFYLFLLVSNIYSESNNVFQSKLLPLCFMSHESIISKAKYLGQNEYIDMNYNGDMLNIDFKNNIKEVFDALSKWTPIKI